MFEFFKLSVYALMLYIIRFFLIGWIEQVTFFEKMHEPMNTYEGCFGFTGADFPLSHFFNYLLWFTVVLAFHFGQKSLSFSLFWKSMVFFGIFFIFFIGLTGVFMNHFNQGIRIFFRYTMLDAVLVFGVLALVNGFLYPTIFKDLEQ
ncbi:MAG: hypothetical protein AAGI07_08565 [Bacteroidota bacterium]